MQNPLFHSWLARWFPWLALLGVVVNATGLFGEIMEPDGALYAAIAKRMALHHDFINLYGDGGDWLDKPHFPFWVTALSFKVLGINAFAYKLPALLFWGMGAFYTCRFTQLVYGRPTAQLATLLYLYAFHLLLSNFDVRAEPYLTGLVVGSVYHFYRLGQKTDGRHLLAGALWCACAVMTKGIFVLIIIGSGLVVHWLVLRQWWQWGRWVWYAAVALVLVFIMPELYVLYRQFDQHPEKWVFGRQGVSGIRFFFWDSQFGRFFNTGPIRGSGDPMFYLHTLLWAFLPWGLLLYAALYTSIRRSIRNRHFLPEYICLGTGLATLLLFSLSQFQLPHYLNIVFPFYAIIVAHWLGSLSPVAVRRVVWVQQGVVLLLVVGMAGLSLLYRPPGWVVSLIGLAVWAGLGLYLFRGGGWAKALGRSCWAMAALGIFLHLVFFSDLLQYQSGMQAGRWLRQNGCRQEPVMMGCHSYSLEFYAPVDAVRRSWAQLGQQVAAGDTVVVLTPLDSLPLLQGLGTVREWQRFAHFPVSRLDMGFVNAATRAKRLQWRVLALVNRRLEQP